LNSLIAVIYHGVIYQLMNLNEISVWGHETSSKDQGLPWIIDELRVGGRVDTIGLLLKLWISLVESLEGLIWLWFEELSINYFLKNGSMIWVFKALGIQSGWSWWNSWSNPVSN